MDVASSDLIREIETMYSTMTDEEYLRLCKSRLSLPSQFYGILDPGECQVTEIFADEVWPSIRWDFDFNKVNHGDTIFSFSTKLCISKLMPVFYIEHQFQVEVKTTFLHEPTLDGCSNQPYSKRQVDLHSRLSEVLKKSGYKEINFAEASSVICSLSMPVNRIFGDQVTVEYALFHDVKDLCP
ncbi:hypothetical protein [Lihuaxuella thermophila]|uniref:Uncharacterized protein n=1 Tax=Lihuaxuella thermophila TaxID=1173111 RepID=A0A1H8IKJ5_9BACL|nr:hypothetical protein [Lihuaxuella thermophila]SEN68872.1 hypothetical protein SAMN05444955_11812 [Lihuaxuella thermophila]